MSARRSQKQRRKHAVRRAARRVARQAAERKRWFGLDPKLAPWLIGYIALLLMELLLWALNTAFFAVPFGFGVAAASVGAGASLVVILRRNALFFAVILASIGYEYSIGWFYPREQYPMEFFKRTEGFLMAYWFVTFGVSFGAFFGAAEALRFWRTRKARDGQTPLWPWP